tara:strand:+ start:132 stop:308 length:177 start_codon:yes stop_codon:yes gene_type:complete
MGFLDKLWTMTDSLWQPKSKPGKKKNLAEHFGTPEEPKKKKVVKKKKKKKAAKKKEKK